MRLFARVWLIGLVASIFLANRGPVSAQQKGSSPGDNKAPAAELSPAKLPDNAQSELVDNPVTFRLVQLAAVETSLKLVDDALEQAGHKSNYMASKANDAENKNTTMDTLGGGPIAWDKFYGKTAEKFFYHPTDPNTTYHNPQPVSQRPPQFDYVYRANTTQADKAKQEVAALSGKIDKLLERRRKLESDQVALWGEISASLVAQRELSDRPLYSFYLKVDGPDPDDLVKQRIATIEAFAQYLRVLDRGADFVDHNIAKNQALALAVLKENVQIARKSLMTDLAGIEGETRSAVNPLTDLAKRIATVTNSAVETRITALEADSADDETRKMSSRGLLQTAMIDFADKTAALDDGVTKLVADWAIKPSTDKPLPEVHWVETASKSLPTEAAQTSKSIPESPAAVHRSAVVPARSGDPWSKTVTLKPPYHESYPGAPTDKLSLQNAVKEILGQAGLSYDLKGSLKNANEECRHFVNPNFENVPCREALDKLLVPFSLTYEVDGETVRLKRK